MCAGDEDAGVVASFGTGLKARRRATKEKIQEAVDHIVHGKRPIGVNAVSKVEGIGKCP